MSIPWKELYAIAVAAATWGHQWAAKRVRFHSDSETAVLAVRAGTSSAPAMMTLIRALFFTAAQHGFALGIVHIAGTNNTVADVLSRLQLAVSRSCAPVPTFRQQHCGRLKSETVPACPDAVPRQRLQSGLSQPLGCRLPVRTSMSA